MIVRDFVGTEVRDRKIKLIRYYVGENPPLFSRRQKSRPLNRRTHARETTHANRPCRRRICLAFFRETHPGDLENQAGNGGRTFSFTVIF